MALQHPMRRSAIAAALSLTGAIAHAQSGPVETVTVSANPLAGDETRQVLTPAKILAGPELRAKLSTSLGDTLSSELGVAASGFGAGASRPIIRGLDGPRIKILQNGMAVADVSSLSNDHAVASETSTAQQIEVLRGPAALLYGSGAIGGLVNVVDNLIPSTLSPQPSGEAEVRLGSVNQEKGASFSLDSAVSGLALHLEGNRRTTGDYRIPVSGPAGTGRLPSSFTDGAGFGLGAAVIQDWGHAGAGLQTMQSRYGIPTAENSFIDLQQNRLDIDVLRNAPASGWGSLKFKLSGNDYHHTEKSADGAAITEFKNRSLETRLELAHTAWHGWEGSWGLHSEDLYFSALSATTGRADTVPATRSQTLALFAVEQRQFGALSFNAGTRLEHVSRQPAAGLAYPGRSFTLTSAAVGGLWQFEHDYAAGLSLSLAQRAPATEELYSSGPHESTSTFDIGDAALQKERSHNLDVSLQKTHGVWRWKIDAYLNEVSNYVYGNSDGTRVDEAGTPSAGAAFLRRYWGQQRARIRGIEAEASYNLLGEGWSARGFGDTSRGTLAAHGNLPLQPATRLGLDLGYRHARWRAGTTLLHAFAQERLAVSEHYVTPSYTKLDAQVSYSHPWHGAQLTWFLYGKNLLNEDIRLATSVLRETVPQPGRGLMSGLRVTF